MPAGELPPVIDVSAAMFTSALHPVAVDVVIDAVTLDRFFLISFEDHEPITLRVSVIELSVILGNLSQAATRALN